MVDPTPDELSARHEDIVRHGETFELDAAAFARARDRADRWGVGALVCHDESVLLVQQDGRWYLPGGVREPGEALAAAARREAREETGVDIEITGLAAVSEQTFRHGAETFDFHFATFEANPLRTATSEDPGLDGEGIDAASWHDTLPEDTFDRGLVRRLVTER